MSPLAITLCNRQGEILDEWLKAVKKNIDSAGNLHSPVIINSIPIFLGNLAEAIDNNLDRETALSSNNVAQEHGGERARVTDYGPDQIVQEYVLLRDITINTLRRFHSLEYETLTIIQRSFDDAIQKSMMAFHLIYNEIRESVVTHLTHDLRTPLTAAKLSLDLILKTLLKSQSSDAIEKVKLLVNRSKKNIDYGNELIQNILDESYLQSSLTKKPDRLYPNEMLSIVNSAVNELSDDIRDQIVITGQIVNGFFERKGIRRLLENLISNAIKYGEENTPVEIKVCETHGRVLLSVHNKGNPIPEEERLRLFNNFERTDKARSSEKQGWGLGLAFCRQVAEEHGGSLTIESSTENGTTFTLDIPIDPRQVEVKS
ncbi:MAG TPA: sensor histidine kinase [Bacteriovoracaceae bacterium]|nr:sensor histidine kinase [Bacteriovoracaceae bacterium]